MPHFFPESADGKTEGPFPGPAHVHVPALILNILADDVAAETVPGAVAGLIRLDPDHRRSVQSLPLGREPFLRDPEPTSAFPVRHPPGPEDMEDAMPFFRPHLVILQALKPELSFDPLAQLLVVIGQFLRIPAFRRGQRHPEDLELVALPEPQERPHPVVAPLLLSGPFPGHWFPPKLLPAAHRAPSAWGITGLKPAARIRSNSSMGMRTALIDGFT